MDSNKFRNRAVTKRRHDITIWRIVTDEDSHQLQTKDSKMTKKHFNAMAIEFGRYLLWLKECKENKLNFHLAEYNQIRENTYWTAIGSFCEVAKAANPAFDKERFCDFVTDIQDGRRDKDGKLVKTTKTKKAA
jgi:hypothetical protein